MVVVTGAAGHIGSNIVRALLERGRPVRAMVRRDTRAVEGLPVELVHADVLAPASLGPALHGAEVVFHCAGRISITGDPDGMVWRINVDGTRNLAEAALAAGVGRLVHLSSCHAFDMDLPRIDEQAPRPGPEHPAYDRSKAASEAALRQVADQGLDAVILNPGAVLGPVDHHPSRTGQALLDLRDGRLPAVIPGGFDWIDVRDVAAAALAAESRGRSGHSYLLSGHWRSLRQLVDMAAAASGVRPPRLTVPVSVARLGVPFVLAWARLRGHEPVFTAEGLRAMTAPPDSIDDSKARAELGHVARPLEHTLADFYASAAELGL